MGFLDDAAQQFGFAPKTKGPFGTDAYTAPGAAYQAAPGMQQAAGFDPSGQDQWRGFQTALANHLQQQVNGQGPSLAAEQAKQSADVAAAHARGLLLNQRGTNPGLAGYLAANAGSAAEQAGAANAVQGRLQEELNAQQGLAALSGQGRGQDLELGQQQQQNNQWNSGQFNQLLAGDMAARNTLAGNQNQQIGGMAQQQQQANNDLRNQAFLKALGALFSAGSGGAGTQALGPGAAIAAA